MQRFRELLCACVVLATIAGFAASSASAQTFYVNNERSSGKSTTCLSPGSNACEKISQAITQAEKSPAPNTIELETETGTVPYEESIVLEKAGDAGLTINGAEPGVVIIGKGKPGLAAHIGGTVTLSNLKIEAGKTISLLHETIDAVTSGVVLNNVVVENEAAGGEDGIVLSEGASLTMTGGKVVMENGTTGFAIDSNHATVSLEGTTIEDGGGAQPEAGGINSHNSALSVLNSKVIVNNSPTVNLWGIAAESDSALTIRNSTVQQSSPAEGVLLASTSGTIEGVRVEMLDTPSKFAGVQIEHEETPGFNVTLANLAVSGTWAGEGLFVAGEDATLRDGRITTAALSASPAVKFASEGTGAALIVQRSILKAAAQGNPASLLGISGDVVVDSSEILGGKAGVRFENELPPPRTLTLAASTVDAGAPGVEADAAGTAGVEADASGSGHIANAAIEGSIVLERQVSLVGSGSEANIACSYSAVPSQAQAAGGGSGAIACGAGSGGNSEASPLSALFAEPLTNYGLNPSSSAVDSVPAGTISLPDGVIASPTDLAGNPRTTDGNGDCVAVQDKGALELQGHSAPCPAILISAPVAKPLAGVLSALTLSPSTFLPAPSGATVSAKHKAKKKYGTNVSYRDSQVATSTFTVLRKSAGRKQGKSCKRPSKSNKHGKRCTLLVKIGAFTHTDKAGANSFHFSGRIKGAKLAPGSYELSAVAHDAAGNGATVTKGFSVK